jgi:hypothetical protein
MWIGPEKRDINRKKGTVNRKKGTIEKTAFSSISPRKTTFSYMRARPKKQGKTR